MKASASKKSTALACVALAGVMSFSQSAPAYTPSGSFSAGPGSTLIALAVPQFPCTANFMIGVSAAGAATVTGLTFSSGSAACPFITPNALPWTIGPATLVSSGVYQANITGVSISIRQPGTSTLIATCVGTIPIRLDQIATPHRVTFSSILATSAPIPGQTCRFSTSAGSFLPTLLTAP